MPGKIDAKREQRIIALFNQGVKATNIKMKIEEEGKIDGSNMTVSIGTVYRALQDAKLIIKGVGRGKANKQEPGPVESAEVLVEDSDQSIGDLVFTAVEDGPEEFGSRSRKLIEYLKERTEPEERPRTLREVLEQAQSIAKTPEGSWEPLKREASPISGIREVNQFLREANGILTPLEDEQRANGEVLTKLRNHLDGLLLLADSLSGKDSEIAQLRQRQVDALDKIADLNRQVATWQARAMRTAMGKPEPGETVLSEESLVDRGPSGTGSKSPGLQP